MSGAIATTAMGHADSARVHAGARVAGSARLGDFVVAYAGAEVGERCRVHGYTQLWPGVRLEADAELGPGVTLEAPADDGGDAIVVGAGARVGAGALLCRGVRLGQGAQVAAGAVEAQNVPPYAIVGGNPAKVLRIRFADDVVAALLAIAWWDWSAEKISRNLERIMAADIGALRAAA